jgi:hypothetical protein
MSFITLNRVVHKSTVQVDTYKIDIRVKDIVAFHDGLIVVGSHQFNIVESKRDIHDRIREAGTTWE